MASRTLPKGWRLLPLGDPEVCVEMHSGFACGEKDIIGGVPHLRMNNITADGQADFTLVRRIPSGVAEHSAKWLEPGDVLFCNTNSTELVGKSCLFTGWKERCTFSNHLTRLRANPKRVMPEWLVLAIRQLWLGGYFATHCREFVGQSAFTQDRLREVEIPLPARQEQQRIVARIENMTGRLGAAQTAHAQAKQSIASLFDAALRRHLDEDAIEGWPSYPCCDLLTPVAGQVDPKAEPYASMPHLGPENLESGTGQLAVPLSTNRKAGIRSGNYLYGPEHVIYCKIRPALRKVFLPDHQGTCSADMYPLLPNRKLISREFLALSLLAPPFSQYAADNSERNAMPKINREVLLAFRMHVPDKDTQRRIVTEILGLQRKARRLAKFQDEIEAELASFTPALLAKAFRGEL